MESVTSPTMHVTEPKNICSTVSEAETTTEEVAKKIEDELLYGPEEDGDEEDVLSDDGMRLRLSDDELDGDEHGSTSNNGTKAEQMKQIDWESDDRVCGSECSWESEIIDFTDDNAAVENNFCDDTGPNFAIHPIYQAPLLAPLVDTSDDSEDESTFLYDSSFSSEAQNLKDNHDPIPYYNDTSHYGPSEKLQSLGFKSDQNINGTTENQSKNIRNFHTGINSQKNVSAVKDTSLSEVSERKKEPNSDDNPIQSSENIIKPTQMPDNPDCTTSSPNLTFAESQKPQVMTNGLTEKQIPEETPVSVTKEDEKTVENPESKPSEESVKSIPDSQESSEPSKSPKPSENPPQQMEIDASDITSTTNEPAESTEVPAIVPEQASVVSTNADRESVPITDSNGDQTAVEVHEVGNKVAVDPVSSAPDSSHDIEMQLDPKPAVNNSEVVTNDSRPNPKSPENFAATSNDSPMIEIMETDSPLPQLVPSPKQNGEAEPDLVKPSEEAKEDPPQAEAEAPVKGRRRRRRKRAPIVPEVVPGQEKENVVRVRRETAQKAEELIRKKYLNDSDSEPSESELCHSGRTSKATTASLKRTCVDEEDLVVTNSVKKPKTAEMKLDMNSKSDEKSQLAYVRKFFLRDLKQKLIKPTQEELEELLIQKVIETITMRDEIGKLREQAKISERNQEATRLKCQQLAKQIKDFEMVLTRLASDRRGNDKNAPPIKINRSVGLQVNFLSDRAVQNLRQLQQTAKATAALPPNGVVAAKLDEPVAANGRKGLKVRSPRRAGEVTPVVPVPSPIVQPQPTLPPPPPPPPATIVVSKPLERTIPVSIATSTSSVMTNPTITLNGGTVTINPNPKFPAKILNIRSNNNNENLIDLTDEEDKTKLSSNPPPLTAIVSSMKDSSALANKNANLALSGRFQRVVQPVSTPTTISQPIRVVKPAADKPTPTAIVNNLNAPRLAFVMQGNGGPTRQLVLAPTANPIRPNIANNTKPTFTYAGVQTMPNGSMRVVPATATSTATKFKHPAPLPHIVTYPPNAALKLPPPAPSLKISKVTNGIVLSWNMALSDRFAEIASYQLYAYQEMNGVAPNSALWKKVGDVRALPLPMACTLTQFSEGNNYYFAVRAVDTHSRCGQYSPPGNISL